MVNYFGDGGEASGVFAVGEENNAADFDEAPLGGFDFDFCHGGRLLEKAISAWK